MNLAHINSYHSSAWTYRPDVIEWPSRTGLAAAPAAPATNLPHCLSHQTADEGVHRDLRFSRLALDQIIHRRVNQRGRLLRHLALEPVQVGSTTITSQSVAEANSDNQPQQTASPTLPTPIFFLQDP